MHAVIALVVGMSLRLDLGERVELLLLRPDHRDEAQQCVDPVAKHRDPLLRGGCHDFTAVRGSQRGSAARNSSSSAWNSSGRSRLTMCATSGRTTFRAFGIRRARM